MASDDGAALLTQADALLLRGEEAQHVLPACVAHAPPRLGAPTPGALLVTTYRLLFLPDEDEVAEPLSVPLAALASARSKAHRADGSVGVTLRCKTGERATLRYDAAAAPSAPLVAFVPRQLAACFAFAHRSATPAATAARDGWQWFDLASDLARLLRGHEAHWRVSDANAQFALCASYPPLLGVPAHFSDAELRRVAQFRSSARVPALSWLHPATGAAIVRCAQPLVGLKRRRCFEDEKMVFNVRDANPRPGAAARFFILDARPKANVLANTAIGGGIEDKDCYPECEIELFDIPNIHVVRDAFEKLVRAVEGVETDAHFFGAVDASGWLQLLSGVLRGTARIVDIINAGHSLLTHCSDGWDRTSQLTSLAMLALDPSYRTLRGFACLIEKEWLSFGHKFQQRHGHGSYFDDTDQISPIFLQFVDAVHQMLRHHPTAFEFNHALLVEMVDAAYSCRFGTFLYNTLRHRVENKVRERTESFWTHVAANSAQFTNAFYKPYPHALRVVSEPSRIVWWNYFFDRHRPHALDAERTVARVMRDAKEQHDALWQQLDMMKQMIRTLDEECAELRKAKK